MISTQDLSLLPRIAPLKRWAETYYGQPVSLFAVTHIYEHRPLPNKIIRLLNGSLSREDVEQDQEEIGY